MLTPLFLALAVVPTAEVAWIRVTPLSFPISPSPLYLVSLA